MIIGIPLLISLIGLIVYLKTSNPKTEKLSFAMFWVGLLAFLLRLDATSVGLLR